MMRSTALATLETPVPGTAWLVGLDPTARPALALQDTLASFEPISVSAMSTVSLLDRLDTKYALSVTQLLDSLRAVRAHYRVLEIEGRRHSAYRTLYFDTSDFGLFRQHHTGRRERYKVRSREYVDSGLAFFEIKRKTGPSRTRKERIPTPGLATRVTPETRGFLDDHVQLADGRFEPKLWNEYTRITLVSRHRPERVTVDLDLRFSAEGSSLVLPGLVAVEINKPALRRIGHLVQGESHVCR
jgi:hypothetical protein